MGTNNKSDTDCKTNISEKMLSLISVCSNLPKDTVRVLELHYLNQVPLKDICGIIGKSISTVRNHHDRGIFLIQKYLNENL